MVGSFVGNAEAYFDLYFVLTLLSRLRSEDRTRLAGKGAMFQEHNEAVTRWALDEFQTSPLRCT